MKRACGGGGSCPYSGHSTDHAVCCTCTTVASIEVRDVRVISSSTTSACNTRLQSQHWSALARIPDGLSALFFYELPCLHPGCAVIPSYRRWPMVTLDCPSHHVKPTSPGDNLTIRNPTRFVEYIHSLRWPFNQDYLRQHGLVVVISGASSSTATLVVSCPVLCRSCSIIKRPSHMPGPSP